MNKGKEKGRGSRNARPRNASDTPRWYGGLRRDGVRARKEEVVGEKSNREGAEGAFREWQDGTGYITDLLAEDLR